MTEPCVMGHSKKEADMQVDILEKAINEVSHKKPYGSALEALAADGQGAGLSGEFDLAVKTLSGRKERLGSQEETEAWPWF